jgi:hypothetical protein
MVRECDPLASGILLTRAGEITDWCAEEGLSFWLGNLHVWCWLFWGAVKLRSLGLAGGLEMANQERGLEINLHAAGDMM